MSAEFSLEYLGISNRSLSRNLSRAELYQEAILHDKGAAISNLGGLMLRSGEKTGRSPKDKRVVHVEGKTDDVWWGRVNIPLDAKNYEINRERAIDYFDAVSKLYVFDGFAGWAPEYRLKVRVICTRPYHALFMQNMLIRPTEEELKTFGEPDFTIMNAGKFPANRHTEQMSSKTSIDLNFDRKELTILGTEYAGEMKKGVFSIMHYLMPKQGVLSMHCSANEGDEGDVSLFFGLSGTGKTTLSADPRRHLIGDDEHCWSDNGVFNIEGGCYAKAIGLSAEKEPEIYNAIRFGSVLENVVYDERTHIVDFDDSSITENTRVAYPIEFIDNAKIPCIGGHPKNIIFLTYDAFGVLPPISKLSSAQAMYHFISGYTAKVAGTEMGVTEPQATFSACFGDAFLVLHPGQYAEMLAEKMQLHGAKAWLINTGMTGGGYGTGSRMKLSYTRAIIDAIHDGSLDEVDTVTDPVFRVEIPTSVPGVPSEVLIPMDTWSDAAAFDTNAAKLASLFNQNFEQYREGSSDAIAHAGPVI